MKYIVLLIFTLLIVQSCGKKDEAQAQAVDQGRLLMDASDCNTCHHSTNRIVGPSQIEIAKKYETTDENTKMIASRIINGGSGVWGDIPMTPHTDLSQEDAQAMARYILSLDEQ
jgi:cytochrome c